ncbi:MAG: hypothetical protein E7406_00295 [Ruminococcaceae bacterium]|nr:hypothetical protein [Oscillospiraceae bacterium]
MKKALKKISDILKMVFGYGIMLSLFLGGATFFGYVVALIIGGNTGAAICDFIYKEFVPELVYYTSILVLLGLVAMYLGGEFALTTEKKQK